VPVNGGENVGSRDGQGKAPTGCKSGLFVPSRQQLCNGLWNACKQRLLSNEAHGSANGCILLFLCLGSRLPRSLRSQPLNLTEVFS
jgi:hypothetical protein